MTRLLTALCLAALASLRLAATTYYVSSTAGSDSNAGTSQAAPWKTLSKVNSSALVPGDTVLLARGDTWRESLVPPASGTSPSPISFDAYGSGAAPAITGYQDLSSSSWTLVSGNVWQASLTATGVNNALFATIWGQKQTSQSAVQHDRDFYFSANKLYIYSVGDPATYYGLIAAITTAAGQLIYVNGKSWLRFQHISLTWFDGFGVNIAGSSDHLVFANMESNGMVPAGTLPHGFYLNANSPGDISFYNVEAHLNYDGFKFDGSATAITLINCKGYANRDGGLVDNTGHATYSYSHFYANNIAIVNSQDIQGGAIDGGNNLPVDTPPAVVNFSTYPARVTFTVDDVGFAPGTETYINSLLPVFAARNLKLSAAVTTGYSSALIAEIQSWLAAGHDINSHSWSHQYYTNTNAFTIRYTGSGTAATLTISGNHMTTTITGGPGGENLNYDLTDPAYDTATELVAAINTHAPYTAALDPNCRTAAHTIGLADVSSHDIKTTYTALFQKDRLEPDELSSSRTWLQTNIPGLSNVKVFVYPDGIQDSQTQAWAVAAGYEGARGALSIGLGSNSVYSKAVNMQNITSLSIAGLHGMTAPQIDAKIAALIFKASVWGVPYGLFIHLNELSSDELATILDSLIAHGATVMTNTQLMDWVAATSNLPGTTTYVSAAPGAMPDFHLTTASPILNEGSNLGSPYQLDLTGLLRPQAEPWDIGAYGHVSTAYGTGSGSGSFTIGVGTSSYPSYFAELPQKWVNSHWPDAYSFDVVKHIPGDYPATMAGLQQSIDDWCAAPDQQWNVIIAHGSSFDGPWTWCTKVVSGAMPARWIVYNSDTPLPDHQTACSHSIGTPYVTERNSGCANDLPSMWTLRGVNASNGSVITLAAPAGNVAVSHIVIKDYEAYPCWGFNAGAAAAGCQQVSSGQYNLIDLSNQAASPTPDNSPVFLGLERGYIHHDYDDTLTSVYGSHVVNTILVGCGSCWFMWNYFEKVYVPGTEAHIFAMTEAQDGGKIAHNWIEGGAIPQMNGGANSGVKGPDGWGTIPTDWEIRQNFYGHNPAWLSMTSTTMKNLFEMKVAKRYLIDANEFAYNNTGAQMGQSLTFNCTGAGASNNYDAICSDVMVSNNVSHATASGFSIKGRSGPPGYGMRRTTVFNNLLYDMGNFAPHTGTSPSFVLRINDDPITAGGLPAWSCPNVTRDSAGVVTAICDDGGTGMHQTDIVVGDPIEMYGCTDTTLNTTRTTLGPLALAGTNGDQANGRTVVYLTGTLSTPATYASETCTLDNHQGYPFELSIVHNTFIGKDANMNMGSAAGSGDPYLARKVLLRDNLIAIDSDWNGWVCCGASEGAQAEAVNDVNTLIEDHMTFPGRAVKKASYYEYKGDGSYITGADASSTLWFPAAVVCPGATVGTDDCIGLAGMMSGATYNVASLTPFTDYVLRSDSAYHAGNSRQASDGKDLGADLAMIQAARSATRYSGCSSNPSDHNYCGPIGPYTD